jgi:cobalamin synthase
MAGDSVRSTGVPEAVKSLILSLVLILLMELSVCAILGIDAHDYTYVPVCTFVGTLASSIWGIILSSKANRTFGSVNGDILGAVNESSRLIILITFVIILMVMI